MESLLLSAVTLSASLALFVAYYSLVRYEVRLGRRVALVRVREGLDVLIDKTTTLRKAFEARIAITFRISRQSRTDRQLANALLRHATRTPLTVIHTDNHLSQMREHKTETALTPAQGRKLRKKKLEERF